MFPPSIANYRNMHSGRIRKYSYKKINHQKARLRQFQATERETVPENVYDIIKRDSKERRIRCTPTNIMGILKK